MFWNSDKLKPNLKIFWDSGIKIKETKNIKRRLSYVSYVSVSSVKYIYFVSCISLVVKTLLNHSEDALYFKFYVFRFLTKKLDKPYIVPSFNTVLLISLQKQSEEEIFDSFKIDHFGSSVLKNKDYCERIYFLVNLLIQKKQAQLSSKSWKQFQMAASENSFKSPKGCFWNQSQQKRSYYGSCLENVTNQTSI